jgi:hypothetical protein
MLKCDDMNEPADLTRCGYKTKDGKPCSRKLKPEATRCWQHAEDLRQWWKAINPWSQRLIAGLGFVGSLITIWLYARTFVQRARPSDRVTINVTPIQPEGSATPGTTFKPSKGRWISSWGNEPPNLIYAVVNGVDLKESKDDFNFVLACRIVDATIDKMTDQTLEHSAAYAIRDETKKIAIPVSRPFLNRTYPPTWVDVYLLFLPSTVKPEQIHTLADAEKLKGVIIETDSFRITGTPMPPPRIKKPPATKRDST